FCALWRVAEIARNDVDAALNQLWNACLDRDRLGFHFHTKVISDGLAQINVVADDLAGLGVCEAERFGGPKRPAYQGAARLDVLELVGRSGSGGQDRCGDGK